MTHPQDINIFWFRRDLRIEDNKGLYNALQSGTTLPVFIFDENILDNLPKDDRRVTFIYQNLEKINRQVQEVNSSVAVYKGKPKEVFEEILKKYSVKKVFANADFEPYGINRDIEIRELLKAQNIEFNIFTDHVIFHPAKILKNDGLPYTVYTPYSKKWKQELNDTDLINFPSEKFLTHLVKAENRFPALSEIGFEENNSDTAFDVSDTFLKEYDETRNFPIQKTSKLGVHLRFGTISIREIVRKNRLYTSFLNELIWREFFIQILYHFPEVVHQSFKPKYDLIEWRNDENDFEKWKNGSTGFPIVDAGMRELNATGFMHNRARMICASFLCKHLLIDWRYGESYFAEKLLDFELASNIGNWQWAAGSGCDAAPYFRVFNPSIQAEKFDPEFQYIKKWIKEFDSLDYPSPMIDHKFARERAIAVYKNGLSEDNL